MKIPTFRKGDRVRIKVGKDSGAHGVVFDTGSTWVQDQGQVVYVQLDGQEYPTINGRESFCTYVGSSLGKSAPNG